MKDFYRKFFRPGDKSARGRIQRLAMYCITLGFVGFVAGAAFYGVRSLQFDLDDMNEVPQRTLVFDRKGEPLGHVSGHGENRQIVPLDQVSTLFIQAILAREDSRFYSHGGVDYIGVGRAVIKNVKDGGISEGASTITMQLARNSYGMRARSFDRKFLEVALAKRMELVLSKDQILENYVNRIYFGSGLYGIERASQGYFMKPASDLSLGEAAMMAGVIRGPSLFSPFRDLESAKEIRDEVLVRMVAEEIITPEELERAKAEPINLRPPDQRLATSSYVLQTVHESLEFQLKGNQGAIDRGGLRVFTTIDVDLQAEAERSLDDHLSKIENQSGFPHPPRPKENKGVNKAETDYLQGAVVTIDNATGGIRAWVGGRDFNMSPFNRAQYAYRPVGSTFKPFVYATAFDLAGLMPGTFVSDDPVTIEMGGGAPTWRPGNSDGQFLGKQPAAVGLIRSRNTMSVRVGQMAGLENVRSLAGALKFGETPESPVMFLGAFEASPVTLTSAYTMLPSHGMHRQPHLMTRIEGADGEILWQADTSEAPIMRESVTWLTSDILARVMDSGTGASARRLGYEAPAYGKTGTTNDYQDAWFVGFNKTLTTGVWVGMDQPKTIMNKGYGSTLALPVWVEVMKKAEEEPDLAAAEIDLPQSMARISLCRDCGLLASNQSTNTYEMNFPTDLAPKSPCVGHRGGLFTGRNDNANKPIEEVGKKVGGFFKGLGRKLFGN